jgi:hypothetical protein
LGKVNRIAELIGLLVSSVLFLIAAGYGFRWFDAVHGAIERRRAAKYPQPSIPPIERIAADLRRLLWDHDRILRSNDYPRRELRVSALERAISHCAAQAARGLDVPCPPTPEDGRFAKPELRRLLRALAAAGLVLPSAVELLSRGPS